MRAILLSLSILSLVLATPACDDVVDGDPDATGDTTPEPDATGDTDTVEPEPPEYRAALIRDLWLLDETIEDKRNDGCRSAQGADGADIDAVLLVLPDNVAYAGEFVDAYIPSGLCDNEDYFDTDLAKGEPDGDLSGGFVTLRGGWLLVEFEDQLVIQEDDAIVTHEIGVENHGASGEDPYEVYLATSLECVSDLADKSDFEAVKAACNARLLSDAADGESTATVPALD